MHAIGLALAADDHLGGVLGHDRTAQRVDIDTVEQDHLGSVVTQPPSNPPRAIGVRTTHHDAPSSRHAPSVAGPSQGQEIPVISPHSPDIHFDVTRESPRLDEFLLPTRRFSA